VARLLEHLFRLWRQGRGKTVDRAVLEDFFKSSRSILNKTSRLSQSINGDGIRLIRRLRAGWAPRLQDHRIDALERYLIEHGYIDDKPILDAGEIRDAVMPLVERDCHEGLLSRERVEQLIAKVTTVLPPSDESVDGNVLDAALVSDDPMDERDTSRTASDGSEEQLPLF
jgi:hypothetical protein